jgi:CRISPR-associated endoribonuclease Cas6/Csy4 subtype I-F
MQPDYYADLTLRSAAGVTVPVIASAVMQILHSVFTENPNRYALAFPAMKMGDAPTPGHILRLFSESRDEIETASDRIEQNTRLSPFVITGRIRRTPEQYEGEWVEYQRYRVPARRGKSEEHQEKRLRLRAKRLEEARNLPYFLLSSASTQQSFSIMIQQHIYPSRIEPTGSTDSYGLSRKEAPLLLPRLG